METNASRMFVYSVAQAFDRGDREQHVALEPGVLARGNFLHWAWQIKFVAAQNVAHVVDKMLHACGGSGYKRDMELERYLRDAKAGWVMGPTNEVLRQFVGKAVLLGFESLDYWNQSYNRRAVENEVKKLDPTASASWPSSFSPRPPRRRRRSRRRPRTMAVAQHVRALLVPGLVPRDPGRETYRVRPGRDDHGLAAPGRPAHDSRPSRRPAGRGSSGSRARPRWRRALRPRHRLRAPRRPSAPSATPSSGSPHPRAAGRRGRRARVGPAARDRARAARRPTTPSPVLPDPLADPRLDFQVDRASALAYEVKAGEYIQVIDVQGRQCSDFLAFSAPKLQDGQGARPRRDGDALADGERLPARRASTRKFFDHDLEPLVEVVRDTVGRHDTFGLACTAKYYEDMGYFGHVNCSDNFNARAEPYTIEPRKGWPAINFFFNTAFDAHNQYVADEPWSRPGDYVLLRAMTDLVCLSSACPDDIDPANAWNPTEVHVRVYPAKERFSAAIAHRVTPDAEAKLTKETGFHEKTSALTSRFTEYNGYWLPTSYDNLGAVDEYWACREQAAVMDLSPLRKFEILGPDAETLLQATMTRDIRRLSDGQVVYTAMCNETGGMLDDGTVFRIAPDNFRFVGGAE